jgi:hypothetical protein
MLPDAVTKHRLATLRAPPHVGFTASKAVRPESAYIDIVTKPEFQKAARAMISKHFATEYALISKHLRSTKGLISKHEGANIRI